MAEQRIVVVSERAPRMNEFEPEAARRFLKEYLAYEMRLNNIEAKIPMRQCLTPGDLETLLDCADDLEVEVVRRLPEGEAAANVRVEMQTPIAPVRLAPAMAEDESSDDGSTVPEEVRGGEGHEQVLYLSNAHIELMIIKALGPTDATESSAIFRAIRMPKDAPFTKLSTATSFIREWKDALRWCINRRPPEKAMVKFFVDSVVPKKLSCDKREGS